MASVPSRSRVSVATWRRYRSSSAQSTITDTCRQAWPANWKNRSRIGERSDDSRRCWRINPKRYVVLSGHPGSGKTLISAGFQPADNRMLVVGRYFAGGHGGSDLPPAYYRHLATFAQWLSDEASFKSGQAEGVGPDTTTAEFARSIAKNLEVICSTVADDHLGILIIDGVEAAPTDTQPSFLEYLPSKPPERLAVVLTTNDVASLLRKFSQLSVFKEVETLPLPLPDCERLLVRTLGESIPSLRSSA